MMLIFSLVKVENTLLQFFYLIFEEKLYFSFWQAIQQYSNSKLAAERKTDNGQRSEMYMLNEDPITLTQDWN